MARHEVRDGLALLRSDVRRALYEHLADLPEPPEDDHRPHGRSAQELADVVGLHLTTVRFHLDQLVAAGLLTSVQAPPAGAGRPRKLYAVPGVRLTAPSDPEALEAYAALSEIVGRAVPRGTNADEAGADVPDQLTIHPVEAGPLDQTPAILEQSGRQWARDHVARLAHRVEDSAPATTPGAWLGKVGAVIDLLVGWGHAPAVRTAAGAREVDIILRDCPFLALAKDSPQMVCGVHRGLLRGALDALGEESAELDLQPLVDHRTCRAHLSITTPFPDRGEQT